ncbi:hypothetical protein NFHSH190041_20340 [Shewanella sp. NFH-SH190041]|nr:hypothetical protein NFHSH190041_20340 [Shewanella sp. NFH-SH190041]
MTDYQQKLIEYVIANSGKSRADAMEWLNKHCPGWLRPQQEFNFKRAA